MGRGKEASLVQPPPPPPPARLCLIVGKGGLSVVMYWRRKDEKQGPLHLKRIS